MCRLRYPFGIASGMLLAATAAQVLQAMLNHCHANRRQVDDLAALHIDRGGAHVEFAAACRAALRWLMDLHFVGHVDPFQC